MSRSVRRGLVRAERHAVADDQGPFNAIGATLFWGAWGYRADRERLEANLRTLADPGVFDFVRILGVVGGPSWEDREVDPTWADYDSVIAGVTDLAYDKYGLRVEWTIFGGSPKAPPGAVREQIVDRFAAMARGREHKIFAFEIANEGWQTGFEGVEELRRLGRRLADRTRVLVSLTSPNPFDPTSACALYAGAGVDAATVHYARDARASKWRPVAQPWSWPDEYDPGCRGGLPPLVGNDEPIGPQTSVGWDDDPLRLTTTYVMTFLARNAWYTFHAGPGVRGGGVADRKSTPTHPFVRSASYSELPRLSEIVAGFKSAKGYLPLGLANWARHDARSPGFPWTDATRAIEGGAVTGAYAATDADRAVTVVFGVNRPFSLASKRAARCELRDPVSGEILVSPVVAAGQTIDLRGPEGSGGRQAYVIACRAR